MTNEKWYSDTENAYRGYRVKIEQDIFDHEHPAKDCDMLTTFSCFHRSYDLSCDKNPFTDPQDLLDYLEKNKNRVIAKTLYLLDHSGLWLSTGRFSCDPQGWDTSRVGYAYIDHDTIKSEYGKVTPETIEKATAVMDAEIATVAAWVTGDIFGYIVEDENGETIDSCWGFFGFDQNIDFVMDEVKAIIDNIYADQEAQAAAELDAARQTPARRALETANRFNRKG